jgi:hypothetical protein
MAQGTEARLLIFVQFHSDIFDSFVLLFTGLKVWFLSFYLFLSGRKFGGSARAICLTVCYLFLEGLSA